MNKRILEELALCKIVNPSLPLKETMEFPLLPITSKNDFDAMEELLKNELVHQSLVAKLRQRGGKHLQMATRLALEATMTNEFASQVTWGGTSTKMKLEGTRLLGAVLEAISKVRSCLDAEGTDIRTAVMGWLRHAAGRAQYRKQKDAFSEKQINPK